MVKTINRNKMSSEKSQEMEFDRMVIEARQKSILKKTKQAEQIQDESYKILLEQQEKLKNANQNLKKVAIITTNVDKDLMEIENKQNLMHLCRTYCCCCCSNAPKKETQEVELEMEEEEEGKSANETQWNERYDPSQKWQDQMHNALQRLLEQAKEMDKIMTEEKILAQEIGERATTEKKKLEGFRTKMKTIVGQK